MKCTFVSSQTTHGRPFLQQQEEILLIVASCCALPSLLTRFSTFEALTCSSYPCVMFAHRNFGSASSLPPRYCHPVPYPAHVCVHLFTTRFCHASTFTVFVQLLIYLGFLPSFLRGQNEWQISRKYSGSFKCSDSDAISIFKFPKFHRRSLPSGSGYRYRRRRNCYPRRL